MPKQATGLIEEVFVSIMSHGSAFDRERTKFLLVRCQVASARNESTTERQRGDYLLIYFIHLFYFIILLCVLVGVCVLVGGVLVGVCVLVGWCVLVGVCVCGV